MRRIDRSGHGLSHLAERKAPGGSEATSLGTWVHSRGRGASFAPNQGGAELGGRGTREEGVLKATH